MLKKVVFTILSIVVFLGCDEDNPGGPADNTVLNLNLNGIEALQNGTHYEGWAIIGGVPTTTGKFNIDNNGAVVDLSGASIANGDFETGVDLTNASAIVITIEPNGDSDTVPAATKYLAGDVSNMSAPLDVSHGATLADDFSSASGKYILATPTNGDNTNENSGIWFLDLSSGAPAQGLTLPVLPAGWKYEGWSVIAGVPVTTGKFTDLAAVDASAPFSGPQGGPPFPGEDFLVNAPAGLTFPTDLAGTKAVISIEPEPDDSPAPFTLKPLVGDVPANAIDHTVYQFGNNSGGFPTGMATIK